MNTPITYPPGGQRAFTVHTYAVCSMYWNQLPTIATMFETHADLCPFNPWEPGEMIPHITYRDIVFPDAKHMRDRQPSRADYSFGGTNNEWDLLNCKLGQEPDTETDTPDPHTTAD